MVIMVDGKWKLTTFTPRGEVVAVLDVKVDDGVATGTLSNDDGSINISNGKFDGKELTYKFNAETPLGQAKGKAILEPDGEQLNGKVKLLVGSFKVEGVRVD